MINKKHLTAMCLALLIVVALTTSLVFIAREADHVCAGDNCTVCAVVSLCRNALKTLDDFLITVAVVFTCVCAAAAAMAFYRVNTADGNTPVRLKVLLLN